MSNKGTSQYGNTSHQINCVSSVGTKCVRRCQAEKATTRVAMADELEFLLERDEKLEWQ